jgi:N utilization substance protein A
MRAAPPLARGDLEIVAIARPPGVLSKVAVRRRAGVRLSARPVSLVIGLGADDVRRVSAELGRERIHAVQWQGDPARYIAEALGLGHLPPVHISPTHRRADGLLGDVDVTLR